ncbi:Arginine repressor [Gammaproteobacteria bacterium]|nr:ArgR family transcriptional regulator [Gammaproteobacteria bacterium]QOJ33040.1 MAG: ArgR family transcriptional regulator [Gammaproteobacteria bacterium]CAG0942764.1 Arginine repressor [Gammaproteobacteria bacterium]
MPQATDSMQKRQKAILAILRGRRVARQSELVRLLKERGIRVTQSSVSRDLQQLGITKLDTGYQQLEQPHPEADRDAAMVAELLREVRTAGGHLTVVKTVEGAAQRVALYLDRSGWTEIVGTVSGDDTIFVATRGGGEQRRLLVRLRSLVPREGA